MGGRIWFWHDCWCGDHPLKVTFPALFEIAAYTGAFVAEMLVSHNMEEGMKGGVGIYGFNVILMIGR